MLIERQTVSRKTPGDGRLEVSSAAAERLRSMPGVLEVEIGTHRAQATLDMLACSCQKVGRAHEHHFVASEVLKTLQPATLVELRVTAVSDATGERTRLTVLPVDLPGM